MPEERSLDPRFDPRYQRGFDPSTMPVEPETLHAPVDEAGPVPPASPVPPPTTLEAEPHKALADDEEAEPPARNPFRMALLLVSIGLLVLAAATLWWSATNQSAYLYGSAIETPQGWMFQALTGIVPAAAIVAGFVGLAIWLGLGALAAKVEANAHPERPRDE